MTAGSVALTGSVTDDEKTDIRAGSSTILLTLTDDSWVTAGAAFDGERQNIINGLMSAQAEANGWNNIVQAGLQVTDVVRTSNTVVTITLPAFAGYDITAQETITVTVPASSLAQSGVGLVASPTFDITVTGTAVARTGTISNDTELDIQAGGSTIILTVTDDTWVVAGGTFDAQRQNIINGLVSAQAEANGWNNVVQAGLQVTDVVRTSNTVVTITLPPFPGYDIGAPETITVTVPATALVVASSAVVAAPTFIISANTPDHMVVTATDGAATAGAAEVVNLQLVDQFGNVVNSALAVSVTVNGSATFSDNDIGGVNGSNTLVGTLAADGSGSVTIINSVLETVTVTADATGDAELVANVDDTVQFRVLTALDFDDVRLVHGQAGDLESIDRSWDDSLTTWSQGDGAPLVNGAAKWTIDKVSPSGDREILGILGDTGSGTDLGIWRWDGTK